MTHYAAFSVLPPDPEADYEIHRKGGILTTPEFWEEFKELVQRGANLWPDASADMKAFCDIVTNGQVMQDYAAQEFPSPKSTGEST